MLKMMAVAESAKFCEQIQNVFWLRPIQCAEATKLSRSVESNQTIIVGREWWRGTKFFEQLPTLPAAQLLETAAHWPRPFAGSPRSLKRIVTAEVKFKIGGHN